jgi:hypothetical protein
MLRRLGQGGFRAAFFARVLMGLSGLICLTGVLGWAPPARAQQAGHDVPAMQDMARAQGLANDPVWGALLHLVHGRPTLEDPGFLLSMPNPSAQSELDATIAALYGARSREMVCRFPARQAWLARRLGLPALSLDHCDELQEFLQRAPADHVALVFASENLAQPSSMMGHLFLKVAGPDAQGIAREHAISFYTDAATFNLPKLLFDSLVIGKQGYFALSPYAQDVSQYVEKEQRTLWEYELRLDEAQRKLLRYHLIELKQSTFTYFFHRHNCATLIKHIVAVAWPGMLSRHTLIDTPKDIVKLASQAGAVETTIVRAPARWRVRAIAPALSAGAADRVRAAVQSGRTDIIDPSQAASRQSYLSLELASAYNQYLYEHEARPVADWRAYRDAIEALKSATYADYAVEAMPRKDPAKSPQDSQLRLGVKHQQGGRRHLTVGVLPVSHTLADDNAQYFGENELRLFDTELRVDVDSGRVGLERFTIYAAKSVLPRDAFSGGWSGQFKVGWEPQPGRELEDRTALLMEGGLGVAWRPLSDVDVYALANGGLGVRHGGYGYVNPVIGAIVREVYGMKSHLTLSHVDRPLGRSEGVSEVAFTQSKYFDEGYTLVLQASRRFTPGRQADAVTATVKRLF